jgi:tRNA-splicing ligase RtcB
VCTDYVRLMDQVMPRYGITLPDRELACAPLRSAEGQRYFGAMCAAANFAFANRQIITHRVREVFRRAFRDQGDVRVVYDVAHNMAKLEEHGGRELCVHRKGATRAFGPRHPETPPRYRAAGQPVFIPGSMGTASWVLAGQQGAMDSTFGTTCHGAGRLLSRSAAQKGKDYREVLRGLEEAGVYVKSETKAGILEEIPEAYKDVDEVVDVVHRAGLAKKVARLVPMGVIKG